MVSQGFEEKKNDVRLGSSPINVKAEPYPPSWLLLFGMEGTDGERRKRRETKKKRGGIQCGEKGGRERERER